MSNASSYDGVVMFRQCKTQEPPRQTARSTAEGTRKRERPRKRWKDEVEEDLNITGINKTGRQWRERERERETVGNVEVLEGEGHIELSA